ncbi:MAG: YqhV family protein [Firmicutes bacterium]|nr:YqhV family protein [Bacillota bacterium]MCL5039364.1 YqhV family protein [Bacillota bacterium]
MFFLADRVVLGMAALRFLSSLIEFTAAFLILAKFNRVEQAVRVNALLGLVGPTIFLLVSGLGLLGLAGRVSWEKMALILLGILFVLVGTTR